MRKVKVVIGTKCDHCIHADEFEVADDTTEEKIKEIAQDVLCNHIGVYWVEAKELNNQLRY